MTNQELGYVTIGIAVLAVSLLVIVIRRWWSRDEIFVGITPGQLPAPGQQVATKRLSTPEYRGQIAVQFHPPRGLRPGLVGTIVDGVADMRDVTATIVDLSVRGYCTIRTLTGDNEKQKDWEITQQQVSPEQLAELDSTERMLLKGMFHKKPTVRMSGLTDRMGPVLREAQQDLYRRTVQLGWYPKHPRQNSRIGCVMLLLTVILVGLGVLFAMNGFTQPGRVIGLLGGLMTAAGPILIMTLGRHRVSRTAYGTAARIQALAFREYLATAEAEQIRFEEAAGIFSRYLPYAIVFGVADHWAKVFGEVAARAKLEGIELPLGDLAWFTLDVVTDVMWMDFLLGGALWDVVEMIDFSELAAGLGEGVGVFVSGVGDFIGSVDGLSALGDGCDGCDLDF